MPHSLSFVARCAAWLVLSSSVDAMAHGITGSPPIAPPASLAVQAKLSAPPKDVTDLKFGEMFALPVGPRGLEPSAKLRELDGQRVRLVGYMVHGDVTSSRSFLLSPLPVTAGDEDESLADDIPASAVLVRVSDDKAAQLPNLAGLIRLTGVLHVGTTSDDASGRNAAASLDLDVTCARALRRAAAGTSRKATRRDSA
jgi:hypothetical protein